MFRLFTFILVISHFAVIGQERDKRAKLEIRGRVTEVSISPDDRIWLATRMSNTYFANSIDSSWHIGPTFDDSGNDYGSNGPYLERISFFNSDTAILTGYIGVDEDFTLVKDNYYLTQDGGVSWELKEFSDDTWIYDVYLNNTGKAWMGGSSGNILFSNDFGNSWQKRESPFDNNSRMHSIFMVDSSNGIAGALHNKICLTTDNWKTYNCIPTPLDQGIYTSEKKRRNDRIEKIRVWNNLLVVNQNGATYFSPRDSIHWIEFEQKIVHFELNDSASSLYALLGDNTIVEYSSPFNFEFKASLKRDCRFLDVEVVNGSMYLLSSNLEVFKVDDTTVSVSNLYTEDFKISRPAIVKKGQNLWWGVNGDNLYLSLKDDSSWFRESNFDFFITDFKVLNDSTVILWDGQSKNYTYKISGRPPELYTYENPLQEFLQNPVESIIIYSGTRGCFHFVMDTVKYELENDSLFTLSRHTKTGATKKQIRHAKKFFNNFSADLLDKTLSQINDQPNRIPSIEDFAITNADKEKYLELVDQRIDQHNKGYGDFEGIDREFYVSVLNFLDTLSEGTLSKVLYHPEGIISTTSSIFHVRLTNSVGQDIHIERFYFHDSNAWHLPWIIEFDSQYFSSASLELSSFIENAIPMGFYSSEYFDNSYLIMSIADYFAELREK